MNSKSSNTQTKKNSNVIYNFKSNAKIYPLKEGSPFDLSDFKNWDIRAGDYESETESYSLKGETTMKFLKFIAFFFALIGLGAAFYFVLTLAGTL